MFSVQGDKQLTCSDCRTEFAFTASEQQFYADRGFTEPRRCPSCRAARKAARSGDAGYGAGGYSSGGTAAGNGGGYGGSQSRGYDRGPREMFSATCASCGREAQVPFQPNGSKPVYCSDCFQSRRPAAY
jgi:CxxC-x17-CxxC domain-containing protein